MVIGLYFYVNDFSFIIYVSCCTFVKRGLHVERPSQYAIMLSFSIVSSLLNEFQYSYQIYASVADLPQSIDINNVLYFPIQEQ